MTDFTHILVPTDFSESADRALDIATAMAEKYGATLTVLHTYEVPVPLDVYQGAPALPAEYVQSFRDSAQRRLDETMGTVRKRLSNARGVLEHGSPYEWILEMAKREKASLIVMGTHGRRGLKHALIGSVAEKVVRLSPIPVLTTHAPA